MVREHIHELEELKATVGKPYHFVGSGLPNVYLVGIEYRTCKSCGEQSADIPQVTNLMRAIARAVVEKEAPLSGPEIRFLRKRLGKKSAEFAQIVGVVPEQVSRWENGDNSPAESADKLIRVFYSLESQDPKLSEKANAHIADWLKTLTGGEPQNIQAELHQNKWDAEPVAA